MKAWLPLLFGLIIFISIGCWTQNYFIASTKLLDQQFQRIKPSLERQNWTEASHQLAQAEETWNLTKKSWALLTHHQNLVEINQTIARIKQALNSEDDSEAQMELVNITQLITNVADREKFSLINIL